MQNFSQHPQFVVEQEKLKCPRCDSDNTKFCYYNNYNLSQPRHFCKSCRRYWTKGGALRNIPVGGGSRKNAKRGSTSASACASASAAKKLATPEEKNEKSLAPKGDGSGVGQLGYFPQFEEGQLGDLMEAYGTEKREALPLKLDDFGNLAEVSGSFSSLLAGSSGGAHLGGLLDGMGSGGLSLHTNYLFCDSDSGQNVDPQTDGLFNVGGRDGGSWGGAGGWPDLAI